MIKQLFAKVKSRDQGYQTDIERLSILEDNTCYPVEHVDMGSSMTYINLGPHLGSFNSVNFEFYTMPATGILVVHDIFTDPDYNPYIK